MNENTHAHAHAHTYTHAHTRKRGHVPKVFNGLFEILGLRSIKALVIPTLTWILVWVVVEWIGEFQWFLVSFSLNGTTKQNGWNQHHTASKQDQNGNNKTILAA